MMRKAEPRLLLRVHGVHSTRNLGTTQPLDYIVYGSLAAMSHITTITVVEQISYLGRLQAFNMGSRAMVTAQAGREVCMTRAALCRCAMPATCSEQRRGRLLIDSYCTVLLSINVLSSGRSSGDAHAGRVNAHPLQ